MRMIKGAQVVCGTCIGVNSPMLKDNKFAAVLLDEATQASKIRASIRPRNVI